MFAMFVEKVCIVNVAGHNKTSTKYSGTSGIRPPLILYQTLLKKTISALSY